MLHARKRPYLVNVSRESRWWLLDVPELGTASQTEIRGEIVSQARDLIATWLDVDTRSVHVRIRHRSPLI